MQIEFVGAAQTVTGSRHLLSTARANVLLDCGMFQGRRRESNERNRELGVRPRELEAVVLSHAHIDHSGALPLLVQQGYRGPIYATPATRDLCAVMLADAAMIQEADARYINKTIERDNAEMDPVEPLFSQADVVATLAQMVSVPYHRRQLVAEGIHATFLDAGHVLGSAVTVLDIDDDGEHKRVVFSGDLGRRNLPILRDPEVATGAHALILESTYGDRKHPPFAEMHEQLGHVISRTVARGGKVLIPSFALERAQEILFALKQLRARGAVPNVPVYVDSPLTVKITEIFKLHPECYDAETLALLRGSESPFDFDELRYVTDKEASKEVAARDEPCIIISASGMCEAGRVVHHLKSMVESDRNTIVIVGFQAQHTLGRRLTEHRPRVRIFGVERDLRAQVVVLSGFSAHADQQDLLDYAEAVREKGHLREVFLVHGEPPAQRTLAAALGRAHFPTVHIPAPHQVFRL
jgi:metallo-beta-lactamase family protein